MSLIVLPGQEPPGVQAAWELVAVVPHGLFDGTNTRPLLVEARRRGRERGRWVLKPISRLTVGESIKELVAYRLAERCGVSVPEFDVIQVNEGAVRHMTEPIRSTLLESLGPNFATRFMPGYSDLLDTLAVPAGFRPMACDIFAFDIGVDNADRRQKNSNLLMGDEQLLAIDHQHAFSWCVPGNHGPDTWDGGILHRVLPGHFLGPVIFRWLSNYSRMREAGQRLDEAAAGELTEGLPEVWLARGGDDYRRRIRHYLDSLFSAWNEMLDQIEGHAAA